jgi:hypothetical protein
MSEQPGSSREGADRPRSASEWLAASLCLITGIAGFFVAAMWQPAGLGLIASAIAFGLLANAVLRK